MSTSDYCLPISHLSNVCGDLGYHSTQQYHVPDRTVRQVISLIQHQLPSQRMPGKCMSSVRTLACSVVFPACHESDSLPSYSTLLRGVAYTCNTDVESLSDNILCALSHKPMPRQSAASSVDWIASVDAAIDVFSAAVFGLVAVGLATYFARWWTRVLAQAVSLATHNEMQQALEAPLLVESKAQEAKSSPGAVAISISVD